jgi:murein DD-endopeptidase MepM/ murein hydrolase activator NlpD
MMLRLLIWVAILGAGWIAGSLYPAPAAITAPVAQRLPDLAARLGIDDVTLDQLRRYMTEEQLTELRRDASSLAARAGEAIVVEEASDASVAEQIASLPTTEASAVAARAAETADDVQAFEARLGVCGGMNVANAPRTDSERRVVDYTRTVDVNGVQIARNPTIGACLSSSFGPRGRGQHRGVDYHSPTGGPILAAADGTVIEARYRDDFGNMLLIDHGQGVYTRYAHLSSFAHGVVEGSRVEAGQQIGLMGNTASYQIPIHLHYEVLTGDYNTPRASFGLTPRSPLAN